MSFFLFVRAGRSALSATCLPSDPLKPVRPEAST